LRTKPLERDFNWVSNYRNAVPPFGHSTQLRVFVDPDLLQYDEVWAAAGTWNDNFGVDPNDIVRVAGGVVTDLKRA
jgi:prolyl-tRNA editing enzyme YbaK/EbsC (Cys-tRNA(Pro) deacylase)